MVISSLREKGSSSAGIRGNAHVDLVLCASEEVLNEKQ